MKDYSKKDWAKDIQHKELFLLANIKLMSKPQLVKIARLLEVGKSTNHKVQLVDAILNKQSNYNPIIVRSKETGEYNFNVFVDFWEYINDNK